MAKKRKQAKAASRPSTPVSRRTVLRSAVGVGVAIVAGAAIHSYDKSSRTLHDLSAIGAGEPVVLQVHDRSCPQCRKLKRATETALEDLPGVAYRIADLATSEGQAVARQYGVGKVTLLLFDKQGEHVGTLQGVEPAAELRDTIRRQFKIRLPS